MTFLCWNLNRRPIQGLVAALVRSEQVDVVILLECDIRIGDVVNALNDATGSIFAYAESPTLLKTIQVFTRFSPNFIRPVEESARYSIRHLAAPEQEDIILAVVHFPSKLHSGDDSQSLECPVLSRMIDSAENQVGHCRTILMGDLNMNPFETGLVGASGLNATMTRAQALKGNRTVQGVPYKFFYNPMWGHFGDRDGGPAGTYYYYQSEHVAYFWNMFDQVLIRPALIHRLDADSVRIVDRVDETTLLTIAGIPDRAIASDHLPLLFTLRLQSYGN